MNRQRTWFDRLIQQRYRYWLDGKIRCRIIPTDDVSKHNYLIELESGERYVVFNKRIKSNPNPSVIQKQLDETPKDILCNNCGRLNSTNICEDCNQEI